MTPKTTTRVNWPRVGEFIAEQIGLHFPPERQTDLQRGFAAASAELGFADVNLCAERLLSAPVTKAQLQTLASHLTVGETYFFRDKKTFDVLAEQALPKLVHSRRARERRLRVWSAACCTGEEAYSLAILLHQIIPDLRDWHVTILATDINERFLRKASSGVYGEWSFRETAAWFKDRYFRPAGAGRYAILPEIKRMVTFAQLNLVEDVYPSLAADTNAMDVIFCRNVLMYFTLAQARKAVRNLHHALMNGGWLVVSPSEASQTLFSEFVTVNFPGVILYQKGETKALSEQPRTAMLFGESMNALKTETQSAGLPILDQQSGEAFYDSNFIGRPAVWKPATPPSGDRRDDALAQPKAKPTPCALAASLYQEGRYEEAADLLLNTVVKQTSPDPQMFSLLARALANQGRLSDALAWCERWTVSDKLDALGHYFRAIVLQELGDLRQAHRSLQRTIYLQPDFVLAHFALGNLARVSEQASEANKHFANALELLNRRSPNEPLAESEGLTAGRLREIITPLVALEASR